MILWIAAPLPVSPQGVSTEQKSGTFTIIFGDPSPDSTEPFKLKFQLVDDQGTATELLAEDKVFKPYGGPHALNGRRVQVQGQLVQKTSRPIPPGRETSRSTVVDDANTGEARATDSMRVEAISLESAKSQEANPEGAQEAGAASSAQALTGSQKWITILVRFSDSAGTTPHPASYFDGLMGTSGTSYPNMDHYWREVSYNNINLLGSRVVGWYNLPNPRSYYIYDQNGDGTPDLDLNRAVADAVMVADADVYFPDFMGINLMFNDTLDCCAWGGTRILGNDGTNRVYSVTWLPPWAYNTQQVVAHEMGHGFGLPHSSGPYNQTYDSKWDPMSNGTSCSPVDPNYGCVGDHTISYHKDKLGWIPSGRRFDAPVGTTAANINIERIGQPVATGNYLFAKIPIGGSSTLFYTVEARRFAGYDSQIPGEAILIHQVDTTRSDRLAQVVDPDNNGNCNDAGAMWTVGETFSDPANNIAVTVTLITASSFNVTITNGNMVSCVPLATQLSVGGTVNGALSTTDCRSPIRGAAYYANRFYFTATAGQQVALALSSTAFDTYLYLLDPSGALVAQDDDSGGGTNSRIPASGFFTLSSSGTYTIEVTSHSPNVTGAYTLSLSAPAPPSCVASISPISQAFDGVGGGGSINVTIPSSCSWTVSGAPSWITILAGGTGNTMFGYVVAANTTGAARSVVLTVAGQSFTVSQAALAPQPPSVDDESAIDLNGDGRADIVGRHRTTGDVQVGLSNGTKFLSSSSWGNWSLTYDIYFADVSGDGKADIIGRHQSTGAIQVGLSDGTKFLAPTSWGTWSLSQDVHFADVNGDGRADIIGRNQSTGAVQVGLSNGATFLAPVSWGTWSLSQDIHFADVNVDGKADIIGRNLSTSVIQVGLSDGTKFLAPAMWGTWNLNYDLHFADVSGDGRADIIGRKATTGDVQVGLSNGTKFLNSSSWGNWNLSQDLHFAAVSTDNKADIIGRHQSTSVIQVGLSNGTTFLTPVSWGTWSLNYDLHFIGMAGKDQVDRTGRHQTASPAQVARAQQASSTSWMTWVGIYSNVIRII